MKIATWNVERLIKKRNVEIIEVITSINADVLVLTETSSKIDLSKTYKYSWKTNSLSDENIFPKGFYDTEENRVTIWSKFPGVRSFSTFNNFTSICQEIETSVGNIIFYGTIIGIEGNRNKSFLPDLKLNLKDFDKLSKEFNFCIVGDLNITFSDGEYFTKLGRTLLADSFDINKLTNLTGEIPKNIDHIVLSQVMLKDRTSKHQKWNLDKSLSDHIGVMVEIN